MASSLPAPDRDFLRFATTGDPDALARVFDATAPRLLVVAEHLTRHAADAEDLVQSAFIAAIQNPNAFEPRRPVLAWLCGILGNHAAELRRRRARRPAVALSDQEPSGTRPPLETVLDAEAADRVAAALDRLPAAERDVCVLNLVHGLSGVEVAHALGRPPATVRTQLRRGLDRIRRILPRSLWASAGLLLTTTPRTLADVRRVVIDQAAPPVAVGGAASILSLAIMKKSLVALIAIVSLAVTGTLLWAPDPQPPLPDRVAASAGTVDSLNPGEPASRSGDDDAPHERQPAAEPESPRQPARITGRIVAVTPPSASDRSPPRPLQGMFVGWRSATDSGFEPVTRTDADGRFTILGSEPLRALAFQPPGPDSDQPQLGSFQAGTVQHPAGGWTDTDLGELRVPEVFPNLTVTVTDPDGRGIEGAFVYLQAPDQPDERLIETRGINLRTDAAGHAQFTELAAIGRWQVQVRDLPLGMMFEDASWMLERSVHFDRRQPEFRAVARPVPHDHAVRGRAVEPAGAPIAELQIEAYTERGQQVFTTDANGRFAFVGEPGSRVTAIFVGPKPPRATRSGLRNAGYEPYRSTSPIPFGTSGLTITLRPHGQLDLQVVDASGEPVTRFHVIDYALHEGERVEQEQRGFTGPHPDGRVTIPAMRGRHELLVIPTNRSRFAPAGFSSYRIDAAASLRVQLPPATRRQVSIRDQDDRGVPDAKVELILLGDNRELHTANALDGPLHSNLLGRPRIVDVGRSGPDGTVDLTWREQRDDRLVLRVGGTVERVIDLTWSGDPLVVDVLRGRPIQGTTTPEDSLGRLARSGSFASRWQASAPDRTLSLDFESLALKDGQPVRIGTSPDLIWVRADGSFEVPSLPTGRWRVFGSIETQPKLRRELATWNVTSDPEQRFELNVSDLLPGRIEGTLAHRLPNVTGAEILMTVREGRSNFIHAIPMEHPPRFVVPDVPPFESIELTVRLEFADGVFRRYAALSKLAMDADSTANRVLQIPTRDIGITFRRADGAALPAGHPVLVSTPWEQREERTLAAGGVLRIEPPPDRSVYLAIPRTPEDLNVAREIEPPESRVHTIEVTWEQGERRVHRQITLPW